ncbi:MAG TPA: MBL fold metallo-hydrolase [Candidatus Acidoferrum sp.]|nr:MBL fold metallo-hydrolase [Candidatus Acidoferrum sp.]
MPVLERAKKKGRKFQNPVETKQAMFGLLFKILKLYKTNKEERIPRHTLGPFHTDASIYDHPPASGLRITWMGHSSMLIEIDGLRVLLDPVWDKRASPVSWAGPKRFFGAPLPLNELPALDVILNSHDHYDHLGAQTIRELSHLPAARNAQWVTSLGVGKRLRCFGVNPEKIAELDWTESLTVAAQKPSSESPTAAELKITALPARHFSGRGMFDRFDTLWSSFVLQGSRHKIYFGADSGLWDGFAEIGRQYGPFDLTMLEVGAFNPLWKSIHMGPDGAAEAFTMMGASGLLMPIHWGLFSLALHAWRQPIERIIELADQSGFKLWSPAPGVPTEVIPGEPHRSPWWRSP